MTAWLFDCDGTLVDTEAVHAMALRLAYQDVGVPEQYFTPFPTRFTGHVGRTIHQIICKENQLTVSVDEMAQRIQGHSRALFLDIAIMPAPHALNLIEALGDAPKAVCSNGHRATVLQNLARTGLAASFPETEVFTKCQVTHAKPAPDLYLLAATTLGVPPHDCIVVEDSIPGVQAGLAAGMTVYGYVGLSPHAETLAGELTSAGAARILTDYQLLLA